MVEFALPKNSKISGGKTWPKLITVGALPGRFGTKSYTDKGLTRGRLYTYRVRAYNDTYYSDYTNTASATP